MWMLWEVAAAALEETAMVVVREVAAATVAEVVLSVVTMEERMVQVMVAVQKVEVTAVEIANLRART